VSIPAGIQFPLQAFQDKSGATDAGKSPATVFFFCVDFNFDTGIVPGIGRGSRYNLTILPDDNTQTESAVCVIILKLGYKIAAPDHFSALIVKWPVNQR
jgi:hypothetical protein